MLPDRVSNPGPPTYESGALLIALRGPACSSSKTKIPSSNYWWLCFSPVTTNCKIHDQTKFHMVKGIDNNFDQMELCFV